MYSAADVWDFAYLVSDLRGGGGESDDLLSSAGSFMAATARTLGGAVDRGAAVQTACRTAELALKGVLLRLGFDAKRLKHLSHRLVDLADALESKAPGRVPGGRLRKACAAFPDLVSTRYAPSGLAGTELAALAMRAQFVAAEALRRVSDRALATRMEDDPATPPRPDP